MPDSTNNSQPQPAPGAEDSQNAQPTPVLSHAEQNEESLKTLERINFWISNCDTKISFLLAFAGILLGGFFSSSIITGSLTKLIDKLIKINDIENHWEIKHIEFTTLVLFIFVILMIVSITYLFRGIKGSIDPTGSQQSQLTTNSNLFFGSIQSKSFGDFKDGIEAQTLVEIQNDYLSQIYINSKICQQKFNLYNQGVTYLIFSTFTFIILNILFLFIR